ncbi:hypothetical protein EV196_11120 [Mariniflexile fucanivorans]|uniref:Pectate lyase-like protein n=1 Tax=Mariniflexile fucanivorans TaxID=264023 RepID=A0A4R1RAM9_9FLAO|nr:hypothetical protein [Mariniflexile fucanivorans]TCL62824.1 hypothetical protein EV196_11120 [Mariniflexile fucanivorans]
MNYSYSTFNSIVTLLLLLICNNATILAQELPKILQNKVINDANYLPDFSFAGYRNGEVDIPISQGRIFNASDYGVIADDLLDDTQSLKKAIAEASKFQGNVVLQLPAGRIILSDILYLERSHFVLRGTGTGENGTEIYCQRPLMYCKDPEDLQELREYMIKFDKRQIEKENNVDLPFSLYTWAGGFIWTRVPGERVKSYLETYEKPYNVLAKISNGKRGEFKFKASEIKNLKIGDVVELQLFNKEGEKGKIIEDLYKNLVPKIGSHHWNFPNLPLVKQQVTIIAISGNTITINAPLTMDILPNYEAQLVEWKHLEEVGMEHFKITFPHSARIAHHLEQGYNGIYLTRLYNGWVKNVAIDNADSGVLSEEIANVTIKNITTTGSKIAHYTVALSGAYNVLAENINVYNEAVHSLSINTLTTKCVYLNCEVFVAPYFDQHSGANHQNLFDNVKVHLTPNEDRSYPLFYGGGAGYWKPSHGAYNTFWNIKVNFLGSIDVNKPIILNGVEDGPFARLIGVSGNQEVSISYKPEAHIEFTNTPMEDIPSLYEYQLKKRLRN